MEDKLKEQDKIVNEVLLNRMREVFEILGVELPDDIEMKKGRISLSGIKVLKPNSHIQIYNDNYISFLLESNYFRYLWSACILSDGSYQEEFNNNSFDTVFFQTKDATITSGFYLYDHMWGSPKIYCNLDNVTIYYGRNELKSYQVDDYLFVVENYLRDKDSSYKRNYPISSKEIDIILKIFGNLIENHVQDLKTNDQSWRFSNERKKIISKFNKEAREAEQRFLNGIKENINKNEEQILRLRAIKEKGLDKLEKMQKRYNYDSQIDIEGDNGVNIDDEKETEENNVLSLVIGEDIPSDAPKEFSRIKMYVRDNNNDLILYADINLHYLINHVEFIDLKDDPRYLMEEGYDSKNNNSRYTCLIKPFGTLKGIYRILGMQTFKISEIEPLFEYDNKGIIYTLK